MNFRKKIFKSKLTNLIQSDPQVTLEDVLLHEQLSITIKNESEILYNRILQKNEDNWLFNIFEYSLFDKQPPAKYQIYNRINQINKNASNFLENCGRKFMKFFKTDSNDPDLLQPKELNELLAYFIRKFTGKPEIYKNTTSAGFFQRFIENFLRYQILDENEIIKFLIPFLVQNCRILAYQQLICTILSDYFDFIHEEICTDFLLEILERAAGAVCFIRKHKSKSPQNVIKLTKKLYKKQNITIDNQPANLNRKPIPLITSFFNDDSDEQDLNENVKNKHLPTIPKIIYENKEDAEIEAYLLIMSIRKAVSMQRNIIDHFRDNYELIKYLLYCGTRSEENSLISLEAFRLLSIIFNGSVQLSIKSWKILDNEKSQIPFYNNFADEMVFNPKFLTYKMIHALPVFWNHRYNIESDELSKKEKFDVNDYYQNEKKHFRTREKGETAFEILQPCMLCEPPLSSQLIYNSIDILIQLLKKRESNDCDLMVIDGIIYDFCEHFDISLETLFSKLIVTKDFSQLPPIDYYYKENSVSKRAILNSFIDDFFLRLVNMKPISFFHIRILEKVFNIYPEIVYNKCSVKEYLKILKKALYKRLENSELYFNIEEEEEEEEEEEDNINEEETKSYFNVFISSKEEKEKYKICEKISEGNTSIIYKVIEKRTSKPFCKKVLKGETATFKDGKNAIKEFEVLHLLNHPCICQAIKLNIEDKQDQEEEEHKDGKTTISILIEYIDFNLSDFLKKDNISSTMKTQIVVELSHGMKYLHSKNIIYRNLNINNIMINSALQTKLINFRHVKINDSPELLNNEKYDNKTDVYSFGVVVYFIFVGKLPNQFVDGKPIKLPKESSSISKVCIELISKCLSINPKDRPSFNEILEFLRENNFMLSSDVDPMIVSKCDDELEKFES